MKKPACRFSKVPVLPVFAKKVASFFTYMYPKCTHMWYIYVKKPATHFMHAVSCRMYRKVFSSSFPILKCAVTKMGLCDHNWSITCSSMHDETCCMILHA